MQGIFIDGSWATHGQVVPNINPSDTNDVISHYNWGSVSDIEAAVAAARRAQPLWADTLPEARGQVLRKIGDRMAASANELGAIIAREQGKTLREGIGEVRRAAEVFHYFAGETVRTFGVHGRGLRAGFTVSVAREPVGVIAVITPWNLPVVIAAWKIGAALAYGNTVVFKPSELTPDTSHQFMLHLSAAGVPAGAVNMVMGNGADLGPKLIELTDAVSFTGSDRTGHAVVTAGARQMKKVQAEMGGKNPLIVHAQCNLKMAVELAFQGAFHGTGQRCTASSRIIVMDAVKDEFMDQLMARMKAARVGHALEDRTEIGPVVDERQLQKNLGFVASAQAEGAELLLGGERLDRETPGFYMAPALFVKTTNAMMINQEEVFGPVATVQTAADLDEAISIANDVNYALSSGIVTTNLLAAEEFRRRSKAAMVMINALTSGSDFHVPFGGRAPSGYGSREQGIASADFYTEFKTSYVNTSAELRGMFQ